MKIRKQGQLQYCTSDIKEQIKQYSAPIRRILHNWQWPV